MPEYSGGEQSDHLELALEEGEEGVEGVEGVEDTLQQLTFFLLNNDIYQHLISTKWWKCPRWIISSPTKL